MPPVTVSRSLSPPCHHDFCKLEMLLPFPLVLEHAVEGGKVFFSRTQKLCAPENERLCWSVVVRVSHSPALDIGLVPRG